MDARNSDDAITPGLQTDLPFSSRRTVWSERPEPQSRGAVLVPHRSGGCPVRARETEDAKPVVSVWPLP